MTILPEDSCLHSKQDKTCKGQEGVLAKISLISLNSCYPGPSNYIREAGKIGF